MAGFLRMHKQLQSLWRARDKDQPFVRGLLLTREGNERKIIEGWFTLLGHVLFSCSSQGTPEFSGAFLADIFSPVISLVDEATLKVFETTSHEVEAGKKVNALHLKCLSVSDVEILLCPRTPEEKQLWMEKMLIAGLKVPTRELSEKRKDGREKVVVIGGCIDESLFHSPSPESGTSSAGSPWEQEWRRAISKVLMTSDAAQVRKRTQVLEKVVRSEQRYVQDLTIITNVYYKQFQLAIRAGHLTVEYKQLDTIFLNCEGLLVLHKLLLSHLEKTLSHPSPRFGKVFETFVPHMSMYVEFMRNFERSKQALEECQTNASFTAFLENHHTSKDCEAHQLRQLLKTPTRRLSLYCSFFEELLSYTSEDHVDYRPIGSALQDLQELKQGLKMETSELEYQQRILGILEGVGSRGFLLLEPECSLILEGDMHLPTHTRWTSGKRRPVYCYLYTNALVVMVREKKQQSQISPLAGASVYQHVSRSGAVSFAKDPEIEIKALKIYSPEGPRNGLVIIFDTQASKKLWLAKISELITKLSPEPEQASSPILLPTSLPSSPSSPSIAPHSPASHTRPPVSPRPASICKPQPSSSSGGHSTHTPNDHASVSRSISHQPSSSSPGLHILRFSGSSPGPIPRSKSIPELPTIRSAIPLLPRQHQVYSIPSLFLKLTSDPPSPHYPDTFLLTYRMFTNAHEVLDALIEEHKRDLGNRSGKGTTLTVQTLRFFNTLKMWVNKYYVDFHHDVNLKRVLVLYLNNLKQHECVHERECELADGILRTVSKHGHIPLTRRSRLRLQLPKPQQPVPASFAEVSAETLAAQLTWIEHETYSRIKPYEFLQQKWTKKNKQELAPNICFVILRFNQMTVWIAKEILSRDVLGHRAIVIQKLLQVSEECLKMNNFVTVFQITSALNSVPIQRLKRTWELLPQAVRDQFEEFKRLTSLERGSKVYREKQKSTPSPSVPYIGPYLNQLIAVEVGMPTFTRNPPEHVNYSKLVRLAAIIEEVTRFQNPHYHVEADGATLTFLDNVLESSGSSDDDQLYQMSQKLEPREEMAE